MDYVVICVIGIFGGGFCVFIALDARRRLVQLQKRQQDAKEERIREDFENLRVKHQELIQETHRVHAELKAQELAFQQQTAQFKSERAQFDERVISY